MASIPLSLFPPQIKTWGLRVMLYPPILLEPRALGGMQPPRTPGTTMGGGALLGGIMG